MRSTLNGSPDGRQNWQSPDWSIDPLNRHHDRTRFDCSKPHLNAWLRESARGNEERSRSRTYVLVRSGEAIVRGYYALSTAQVSCESIPLPHSKKINLRLGIPAIRLGRLAVDVAFQRQKLGSLLLFNAMRRAQDAADLVGCAILTLDLRDGDEDARRFYVAMGFLEHEGTRDSLFLPITMIRDLRLRELRT